MWSLLYVNYNINLLKLNLNTTGIDFWLTSKVPSEEAAPTVLLKWLILSVDVDKANELASVCLNFHRHIINWVYKLNKYTFKAIAFK